jgi:hypothetical protein
MDMIGFILTWMRPEALDCCALLDVGTITKEPLTAQAAWAYYL